MPRRELFRPLERRFGDNGRKRGRQPEAACTLFVQLGNAVGPVGAFNPSSNGLYDMHGNVAEICLDWYEDNIATATDTAGETYGGRVNVDAENPAYPLSHSAAGSLRARRGGNWSSVAGACRSASRDSRAPQTRAAYDGFRVICPVGIE